MIDDTLCMQASCWFMTKEWYKKMGFMQIEGYTGWGQESEEICNTTWLNGGEVKTNKNTWYAHLHKGKKYGRMYFQSRTSRIVCDQYSFYHWFVENNEGMIELLKKFNSPNLMPNWPENWEERVRELKTIYAKK